MPLPMTLTKRTTLNGLQPLTGRVDLRIDAHMRGERKSAKLFLFRFSCTPGIRRSPLPVGSCRNGGLIRGRADKEEEWHVSKRVFAKV